LRAVLPASVLPAGRARAQ